MGKFGTITIAAEEMDSGGAKEVVQFHCNGTKLDKKDFFGKSDPFLCFYRLNEDNSRLLAYRSEFIKRTLNPVWKPMEINSRLLCHGNHDEEFLVQCFDWDFDGGSVSPFSPLPSVPSHVSSMLSYSDWLPVTTSSVNAAPRSAVFARESTSPSR